MLCSKSQQNVLKLVSIGIVLVWLISSFIQDQNLSESKQESDYSITGFRQSWYPRQRHLANILDLQLKHVKLFSDTSGHRHDDFDCIQTQTRPSFPICVYDIEKDIFISAALKTDGIWEPFITKVFQSILNRYPEAWVIDVGANIGYYTLLSARMGHNVIAIEPVKDNYVRLHKSLQMGGMEDRVYLVTNALSNTHSNVSFRRNINNQGGIRVIELDSNTIHDGTHGVVLTATMDDLLQIIQGHQAIMKLDIEGYECKVMKKAKQFLKNIYTPYIIMEWKQMFIHQRSPHTSCTTQDMQALADFLSSKGYEPYEIQTHIRLNPARSTKIWRIGDIYWKLQGAKPIQPG